MIESMLTTKDNPHDPFDDYDSWYAYDTRVGHNTLSFLARIVSISYETSEADQNLAIERAIDEIVEENVNGLYVKVSREATKAEVVQ